MYTIDYFKLPGSASGGIGTGLTAEQTTLLTDLQTWVTGEQLSADKALSFVKTRAQSAYTDANSLKNWKNQIVPARFSGPTAIEAQAAWSSLEHIPRGVLAVSGGFSSGTVSPPGTGRIQPNTIYLCEAEAPYSRDGTVLQYAYFFFRQPLDVTKAFEFTVMNTSEGVPLRLLCSDTMLFVRGSVVGTQFSHTVLPPKAVAHYVYLPETDTPHRGPVTLQKTQTILEFDAPSSMSEILAPPFTGSATD